MNASKCKVHVYLYFASSLKIAFEKEESTEQFQRCIVNAYYLVSGNSSIRLHHVN